MGGDVKIFFAVLNFLLIFTLFFWIYSMGLKFKTFHPEGDDLYMTGMLAKMTVLEKMIAQFDDVLHNQKFILNRQNEQIITLNKRYVKLTEGLSGLKASLPVRYRTRDAVRAKRFRKRHRKVKRTGSKQTQR